MGSFIVVTSLFEVFALQCCFLLGHRSAESQSNGSNGSKRVMTKWKWCFLFNTNRRCIRRPFTSNLNNILHWIRAGQTSLPSGRRNGIAIPVNLIVHFVKLENLFVRKCYDGDTPSYYTISNEQTYEHNTLPTPLPRTRKQWYDVFCADFVCVKRWRFNICIIYPIWIHTNLMT